MKTKKEIVKIVSELDQKYNDLVWYARSMPEHASIKGVKENKERIEKLYPNEVEKLQSENYSDWQHGFHSGMLAGMRYILTMDELGKEQADDEFPMLDT